MSELVKNNAETAFRAELALFCMGRAASTVALAAVVGCPAPVLGAILAKRGHCRRYYVATDSNSRRTYWYLTEHGLRALRDALSESLDDVIEGYVEATPAGRRLPRS